MIGIAVGSTCGVLIFIALLVTVMAVTVGLTFKKRKKKSFDFSTNVAYSERNTSRYLDYESIVVTRENTAYTSSLTLSVANKVDVEYESFHDSTSTDYDETNQSDPISLTTQKNIAYQPSMVSNISYGFNRPSRR